MKKFLHN